MKSSTACVKIPKFWTQTFVMKLKEGFSLKQFIFLRGSAGALVSSELQRYSVDVGFMPFVLILKLETPLPFARISFVPTTSLSCLEKSGCQRRVCAHEKTKIESMCCIGTSALQLFFCTVDGYMQLDDNTGIACSNMDASICFGGWRYWIWNMRSIWLCRGLRPCLWKPKVLHTRREICLPFMSPRSTVQILTTAREHTLGSFAKNLEASHWNRTACDKSRKFWTDLFNVQYPFQKRCTSARRVVLVH